MQVNRERKNAGFAVLEYTVLIIIIMATLMMMAVESPTGQGTYLQSALQGQMKRSGELFGQGRQYNPQTTKECICAPDLGVWYFQSCYENEVYKCNQAAELECWKKSIYACMAGCPQPWDNAPCGL
jgi:hypothetical protein